MAKGKSENRFEVVMEFRKETPGTFVFETMDDKDKVLKARTLYIQKAAMIDAGAPKQIKVTVEW